MANDDPTSLSMRFGGKEAFRSGVRGFRVRSTSQLNAMVGWLREEAQIRELVARHPELGPVVRNIVADQAKTKILSTTRIIQGLYAALANK